MRPHERPPRIWPVVLASLVGFAILVSLGIWQVQRLQWKEGLLAQLAANASAGPIGLDAAERLAAQGGNVEYLKVRFRATYKHDSWMKMISTYDGGQGWTIITPAITPDGRAVIVDRGRLPGQLLDGFGKPEGEVELTGVVRTYIHGQATFDPDNDPAGNFWYWWDVPGMLKAANLPPEFKPIPFVVQLLPGAAGDEFPKPPEPRAVLSNNHLGYALTWFGLAAVLAAMAFSFVASLKRRRNS